ncbi:MAG: xylan 1,4-beta-xylosidase [Ruminococcaceae bacterium]|nr:xylan 1,4-beta-xylosidase [Oscillospiraceae bacterium]
MAKEKKPQRFIKQHTDGSFSGNEIWVDRETGVNYFFHASGYAGGLTVLLDREGKPIITPIIKS